MIVAAEANGSRLWCTGNSVLMSHVSDHDCQSQITATLPRLASCNTHRPSRFDHQYPVYGAKIHSSGTVSLSDQMSLTLCSCNMVGNTTISDHSRCTQWWWQACFQPPGSLNPPTRWSGKAHPIHNDHSSTEGHYQSTGSSYNHFDILSPRILIVAPIWQATLLEQW